MYKCSPCIPRRLTLMLVVCATPTSLRRPDPAVLLKETVKRTDSVSVHLVPLYVCPSQCATVCFWVCFFFSSSFLTHCSAKRAFHHRLQCHSCPKQFRSYKVKQKGGFLGESSWATVQSLKRMERGGWSEGEYRERGRTGGGVSVKGSKLHLCLNTGLSKGGI